MSHCYLPLLGKQTIRDKVKLMVDYTTQGLLLECVMHCAFEPFGRTTVPNVISNHNGLGVVHVI